jgi:hypothetical protein
MMGCSSGGIWIPPGMEGSEIIPKIKIKNRKIFI